MAILILVSTQVGAQDFYVKLNEYRRERHLRELEIDTVLEKESLAQINKINTKYHGKLIHGSVIDKNHKYKSEVLAKNSDLEIWLISPPHRKAILNRKARKVGFAKVGDIACARLSD